VDFVPFMPGVASSNDTRRSVINGLPRGTINITLDGVNVQDKGRDGYEHQLVDGHQRADELRGDCADGNQYEPLDRDRHALQLVRVPDQLI
jgi:hypothetical protein